MREHWRGMHKKNAAAGILPNLFLFFYLAIAFSFFSTPLFLPSPLPNSQTTS